MNELENASRTDARFALSKWRSKPVATLIAFAMVVFLGAWMGSELWPHFANRQPDRPPKADAPSLTQAPVIAPNGPDTKISMLGTESSVSDKPLALVLVATSTGRTLEESTASLGTDPRNPQTYAGGAILANGARIEAITPDHVILRLAGRRAVLLIDRDAPARVAKNQVINDERIAKGYPVLTPALSDGIAEITSIGGKGSAAIDRVATSREDLSAVVRPTPVFENDEFAGLSLIEGTDAGHFADLGLERGDILRSIDGKRIKSDAAWEEVDVALSSGASIVVGIERNGSLISMLLDGSHLMQERQPPAGLTAGPPANP